MSLFRTQKWLMSTFRISYFPHSRSMVMNNLPLRGNNPGLSENKAGVSDGRSTQRNRPYCALFAIIHRSDHPLPLLT